MLKKLTYIIIPIFFLLQGCNSSVLTGILPDDELNNDVTIDISSTIDNTQTQKDGAAFEKNQVATEEEIQLSGNLASVDIDSEGRTSPFVPYRERNLKYDLMNFGDLPAPPISGEPDESINQLITAKVTGIIYDDKSPSALVNVLDDDYLVKPGDKIESFEIATITKDYVGIKTGSNIYRAKVGDIVDGEMYGTGVYNLGHRFAGRNHPARNEDIVVVKMKKDSSEKKGEPENFNNMSLPPIPEINTILPKVKLDKDIDLPAPPIPDTN
ncbi:MAG: hypothetical protein MJ180_04830 [Candidatus Gastranaerophilales bacterium]|nr:hypothetical protein [Candidatus Gastranaerophilales bacterium]